MTTKTRFFVVLAALAAIVIAGLGAPAWADRLSNGVPAQSAGIPQAGPAAGRPQGTVVTTEGVIPITSAGATVGSCATVKVNSPAAGVDYVATIVPSATLPTELPGSLLSCGVQVEAKPGTTLGAEAQVCFAVPPTQTGFAYYWDGGQWVKATKEPKDGQACVDIPPTAASPAYAGLFDN